MTITTEEAERLAERLETRSWRHDNNNDIYPEPSGGVFINGVFRGHTATALRSLAAERDDLAKRLKDAERERNHQHGRADRNAAQYAAEQAKREQLQAENENLRAALRPFIYTGNVEVGFRIGQNPPPPTTSEEEAWAHYGGSEFHYQQWLQWRAVKIGRELLGEKG
jgi:hypothetical protein